MIRGRGRAPFAEDLAEVGCPYRCPVCLAQAYYKRDEGWDRPTREEALPEKRSMANARAALRAVSEEGGGEGAWVNDTGAQIDLELECMEPRSL